MKELLITEAIIILIYMTLWYVLGLWLKRNDVVDVAWGLGFATVSLSALFLEGNFTIKALLVCSLVFVWGVRLASHIYSRNKGKTEDFRYQKWREDWGSFFYLRSYFQIYILQGILMFVISLPVLSVIKFGGVESGFVGDLPGSVAGLNWLDFAGLAVWVFGFSFETIGDWQLSRFIQDPEKSGIMTEGLWKYTRHPNYFGEVTQWWGIWLIALSVKYGLLSIVGPLTITILILKVSGVPPLEEKYSGNEEYEKYKKKTSKFIPLPPKGD